VIINGRTKASKKRMVAISTDVHWSSNCPTI